MARARPARDASASASAAEASAAVGRWGVLSILESIHASFPDWQVRSRAPGAPIGIIAP